MKAEKVALLTATVVPILGIIGLLIVATAILCHGAFVYSLNDPYISLSLGWHIGHGHYGLNDNEAASPASSILYPFLLAPFSWMRQQEFMPLVINSAAAAGTAAIFASMFHEYDIVKAREHAWRSAVLIVALCVAINIVGVVFTGLEHSLHILASVGRHTLRRRAVVRSAVEKIASEFPRDRAANRVIERLYKSGYDLSPSS
jgi:hypothetical protein